MPASWFILRVTHNPLTTLQFDEWVERNKETREKWAPDLQKYVASLKCGKLGSPLTEYGQIRYDGLPSFSYLKGSSEKEILPKGSNIEDKMHLVKSTDGYHQYFFVRSYIPVTLVDWPSVILSLYAIGLSSPSESSLTTKQERHDEPHATPINSSRCIAHP
jgi:hypothetical protein